MWWKQRSHAGAWEGEETIHEFAAEYSRLEYTNERGDDRLARRKLRLEMLGGGWGEGELYGVGGKVWSIMCEERHLYNLPAFWAGSAAPSRGEIRTVGKHGYSEGGRFPGFDLEETSGLGDKYGAKTSEVCFFSIFAAGGGGGGKPDPSRCSPTPLIDTRLIRSRPYAP